MIDSWTNGGTPYTEEQMADMPEQFCDVCSAPVDSFCREGKEITFETANGGIEQLCYDCQWERHNKAVYVADGVVEQQKGD